MSAGSGPSVRVLAPHEWQAYRAIRPRAPADAPDAFGSTLAAEQALPPATWEARVAKAAVSGIDCPLVAELDGGGASACRGPRWTRPMPAG